MAISVFHVAVGKCYQTASFDIRRVVSISRGVVTFAIVFRPNGAIVEGRTQTVLLADFIQCVDNEVICPAVV